MLKSRLLRILSYIGIIAALIVLLKRQRSGLTLGSMLGALQKIVAQTVARFRRPILQASS